VTEQLSVAYQEGNEMDQRPQHVMRKTPKREVMSARRHPPRSRPLKAATRQNKAHQGMLSCNQLEAVFACLPESVIVCNREEKILHMNAAALQLFEVPSEEECRGTSYQQFLQRATRSHKQYQTLVPAQWLLSLVIDESATVRPPETILELQVPSGRTTYVNQRRSSVLERREHVMGVVYVLTDITHCYQKALRLQCVHEAVLSLTETIAHLPERFPEPVTSVLPQGLLLFSPPVVLIAQQLVDLIRQVLNCQRVSLKALGPTGYYYYLAGSGFPTEQGQPEQKASGHLTFPEVFGETVSARLSAKMEVILPGNSVHLPPGFGEFASENLLLIPLFLEKQLAGALCMIKAGLDSGYTPEEIELVKVVAAQAELLIECLSYLQEQAEAQTRSRVLHEVEHLSHDFLILASHELRTPLTGILGNLQLAQRRLALLHRQIAAQSVPISEHIAQAQQPLASASQSARLQQRMLNDIIDDARIQANQLEVRLQPCDLLALLRAAIARQQRLVPERRIVLEHLPQEQPVPLMADGARITQVFTTYLANALTASPVEEPVTVSVRVKDLVARVSVHNEGPGIPFEEQEHLWERCYRAKGSAIQQELDLSLGLGLYLCRALIERHAGLVGVQSAPGQGATFWFTLPLTGSPGK
jgi:signal transduction histidine kinase/PAS domain-containing protein